MVNFFQYNSMKLNKPTRVYYSSTATSTDHNIATLTNTTDYYNNKYFITSTASIDRVYIYRSEEIKLEVKKLLKRMNDEMCKSGWVSDIPYYLNPYITPMNLRSVRLEGRGWGNKK